MQRKSNVVAVAIAVMMILSTVLGCSAVNNNPVIGKVGDVDITYSMYANAHDSVKQYYEYGAIQVEDTENPAPELRQQALDQVIDTLIPIAMAHKNGVTLTEEDLADVDAQVETQIQEAIDQAAAELGSDLSDEAKINYFENSVKQNGYTMAEYRELVHKDVIDKKLADKMKTEAEATAVASEEIMKKWYQEEIKYEKQAYAEDLGAYYNATQYYSYITGVPPLTTPEGFVLIKQILIFNPAEGETKDMQAIVAEVQKMIEEGVDFDELINEYNEDPGMIENPEGYLFADAIAGEYMSEFSEAAASLAEGEISGPVETSEGIHFLKNMGPAPTDVIPYEEIEEPLREYTLQTAKDELYQKALEDWRGQLEITTDMKRIESLDRSQVGR